ncbi:MAG: hypothetical protein ABIT16_03610 [Croceibacterium sp.]
MHGPDFVLSIIAIAAFAGVMKAAVRAKYGRGDEGRPSRRRGSHDTRDEGEVLALRAENARLTERVEAYEDRVVVLERIVTDKSYDLSEQIEALRDRKEDAR